ncbi:DUF4352 domain-containing protein [Streptomyces cocklensis]|uniref:DUF4352 domain-containing protein n=1 Tax=Actinacidiphila cocklensis TaxID=887465 RepID=A0A9W4DTA4_9ACTN|nr:DUF4352 domain-containing protein [Actinacidiphila cocklensis]MDD1058082.1 DUF4352 domain-containing protein [Actinacidiphila cocklensis]CAG6393111.1 conserved exported hypothetical protein [Actinacidiphila cocklensis]
MRRIALTLAVAGLAVALTACGGTSVKTSPDSTTQASVPAATATSVAAASTPTSTKPTVAHIGDTITLHGSDPGLAVAVTVVAWNANAHGADEFTTPSKGKRFVAAQFKLVNTGSAVYSDSPSNGAQVADSQGQRFSSTFAEISAGPSMSSNVNLRPGDMALGWIPFEVPISSTISTVQFALDSGFADQVGEWSVK